MVDWFKLFWGRIVDFFGKSSDNGKKFADLLPRFLSSIALLLIGIIVFFGNASLAVAILLLMCSISFWEYGTMSKMLSDDYKKLKFFFFLYIIIAVLALFFLRFMMDNYILWVGTALLITASSDIMAYFSGRFFGGMHPFPNISQGKTLSGYIGGLIAGSVVGFICFVFELPVLDAFLLAFSMTLGGQMGDLFESYLKRIAGVKDSGKILPGHGGILDRFDAFFATIIILFFYLVTYHEQGYERFISIF